MPRTVFQALAHAEKILRIAQVYPADRQARWLLEHVLLSSSLTPESPVSQEQLVRFMAMVNQRADGYPLQYLIGSVDFYGCSLQLSPAVLIPRPETEYLVELLLLHNSITAKPLVCADLGTGSGCLAIALANALPASQWLAGDISLPALALARRNAEENGVADRINFCHGSWFDAFPKDIRFDCIVTNPPYVSPRESLQPEVLHEPHQALFSNRDGYEEYDRIIRALPDRMNPDGIFMGEFGLNQESRLNDYAQAAGFTNVYFKQDLTNRTRYIVIVNS